MPSGAVFMSSEREKRIEEIRRKEMKFDIYVLLDRSGSMEARKEDHIGGLRSFINDQKGQGETDFTLIQFDSNDPFELVIDGKDIESIDSNEVYLVPRGGTPLLDAVGKTVAHIEERTRNKEVQVVLMVITDGAENQSKEWTRERISKAIKEKENDWKILYLGANVDAFGEASVMGINTTSIANYANDAAGAAAVYNVSARKLNNMRSMYHAGLEKTSVVCSLNSSFTAEDNLELTGNDSIVKN